MNEKELNKRTKRIETEMDTDNEFCYNDSFITIENNKIILKIPKAENIREAIIKATITDYYICSVEGMVQKEKIIDNRSFYEIRDETIGYEDKVVKIENRQFVVPSKLTIEVPIKFLKWDEDSELGFLGIIKIGRNKVPFMEAFFVYPAGFVCEKVRFKRK